jgi:hypothetical protein
MRTSSAPIHRSGNERRHAGGVRRRLSAFATIGVVVAGMSDPMPGAGAPAALAAPPEDKFFTEVIDEEFPSLLFTQTCGFDTWYTLQGTITFSLHDDDLTIVRWQALERTLNGPGGSLSLRETGVDQIWTEVNADGFVESIHGAGRLNHSWVVPGYGPVELNAGTAHYELTFVWDETAQDFVVTEEVLHEGGPRDRELTDDDVSALCHYLG